MGTLEETKREAIADIKHRIDYGIAVGDEVLLRNYLRIEVIGKSIENLQARIIYPDQAPFYFQVTVLDQRD